MIKPLYYTDVTLVTLGKIDLCSCEWRITCICESVNLWGTHSMGVCDALALMGSENDVKLYVM